MDLMKDKNDPYVRRAIWEVYKHLCYLCKKPVIFNEVEIDHILPKELEKDPKKFDEVRNTFKLPLDFQLDSYQNYALICSPCNKRKLDKIHSILTQQYLENAKEKAPKLEKIEDKLRKNQKIAQDMSDRLDNFETVESKQGIKIGIFSKASPLENSQYDKLLDFNLKIKPNLSEISWQAIYDEIVDLKKIIDRGFSEKQIFIDAKSHLTIGYMFGYIFRKSSGYSLSVGQNDEIWDDLSPKSGVQDVVISHELKGTNQTDPLCIYLSITREVKWKADQVVPKMEKTPKSLLYLSFKEIPRILKKDEVSSILSPLFIKWKEILDQGNITETHIFGAIPLALAVLIGANLNAMTPIQLYEYDDQNHIYVPSFILK